MQPVPLNDNVLTGLFEYFQSIFIGGAGVLKNPALSLFGIVLLIDLLLAILLNLGEVDNIKLLVKKILKYGLIYGAIFYFPIIITYILDGFIWVGNKAGSGSISAQTFVDPSLMTAHGFKFIAVIFSRISNLLGFLSNPMTGIPYLILGLLIFFSLTFIGIQIFLTYLEFYIVAVLSLILIPFGANKYTSFIAQKAGNAIFSLGVKLMVLAFISAAMTPILVNWTLPPDFDMNNLLYLAAGTLCLAFLSWHAPNLASSLMSGMPSLNAGSIVGPAVSTVTSAVITGVSAGAGAPVAATAAGGSAIKAATNVNK